MKKEFIDYLYEQRAIIQNNIDEYVKLNSQPRTQKCHECGDEIKARLEMRRNELKVINETIQHYFQTHSKSI